MAGAEHVMVSVEHYDPTVADRKRRLTVAQIRHAIAWLECNEGADGEADNCQAVADWLKVELNQRVVRSGAREMHVKPWQIRNALAKALEAK